MKRYQYPKKNAAVQERFVGIPSAAVNGAKDCKCKFNVEIPGERSAVAFQRVAL